MAFEIFGDLVEENADGESHRKTTSSFLHSSRNWHRRNCCDQLSSKPKLLDQVRHAIHMRHYSPKTEESYIGWIKRFILFHNKRHPLEMGEAEIAQFLSSLATDRQVSASTQNQALNAILFLYHEVLHKNIGYVDGVIRAKKARRLPVVLTKEEVKKILGRLAGTPWLMAMLLYGAGMRVMECCEVGPFDGDLDTGFPGHSNCGQGAGSLWFLSFCYAFGLDQDSLALSNSRL
jgi:hypothetical protein